MAEVVKDYNYGNDQRQHSMGSSNKVGATA